MKQITHILPTGLVYHCEQCQIVIPVDAPKAPDPDCVEIKRLKLTFFDPTTTIAGQFCMAAAAWELIHHKAVADGHTESIEYKRGFNKDRKNHFAQSATRKAMTQEQLGLEKSHERHGRRDAWLYKEDK